MALEASGSQSATIGVEHTIFDGTSDKSYVAYIDLSAMVAGDAVVVARKIKVDSGGTLKTITKRKYGYRVALVEPCLEIPITKSDLEYSITLKQITGTGRSYPYRVLSL